jgi:hypothetical protein
MKDKTSHNSNTLLCLLFSFSLLTFLLLAFDHANESYSHSSTRWSSRLCKSLEKVTHMQNDEAGQADAAAGLKLWASKESTKREITKAQVIIIE